jgi:hypothetical protein
MIEPSFKIQLSPALNQKDIMKKLIAGEQPTADDLAQLAKVKAKLELIGDYEDMEKVRNFLISLSKKS